MTRSLRLFLFLALGVLLGGGCSMALAQSSGYSGVAVPPNIRLAGPNMLPFDYSTGRYVGFGAGSGGGAALNSSYSGRLGGALVPISGVRTIPASGLARAAKFLAKKAGPIGVALTLADLIWNEETQQFEVPTESSGYQDRTGEAVNINCSVNAPGKIVAWAAGYETMGVDSATAKTGVTPSGWYAVNNCDVRTYPSYGQEAVYRFGWVVQRQIGTCTAPNIRLSDGSCGPAPRRLATDQEIEDAIYTELVARNMGSELARRLVDAGYEPQVIVEAGPQNLSGPASVPGQRSTSSNVTPQGTTTTITQTNYNITYQGDTINITETTTTTTTNPDGSTETKTETKEPAADSQPAEQEPQYSLDYQNADFPPVPDFYEQKYPDGLKKVWDDRLAQLKQSPLFNLVGKFTDGAPSSGTCPSWTMNFSGMGLGVAVLEPPCNVWPFLRVVILLTALFVARRLVFGG